MSGLANYEDGRYRCICRCLMAEIERALRIKLNKMIGRVNFPRVFEIYASQGTLNGMFAGNIYEFLHFEVLSGLYKQVSTEEARRTIGSALNRHAVVHGLSVYNTKQQSYNALVLSLYWFCCLSQNDFDREQENLKALATNDS